MILAQLLKNLPYLKIYGNSDIEIENVSCDSNDISGKALFCCIKGLKTDGHNFIRQAINNGAVAVCVSKDHIVEKTEGVTFITVTDTKKAFALICDSFYSHPADNMKIIGVTGTNGKTTTVFMIEYLLNSLEKPTGLMGTLYTKIGDEKIKSSVTTPDAKTLSKNLADMLSNGMEAAVFEVSSHSLALDRVYACNFDRAVFTNLTQDHLDFHKDFDEYFQAKMKLFESLSPDIKESKAIINTDDQWSGKIISKLRVPFISYGIKHETDFKANDFTVKPDGIEYDLIHKEKIYKVTLSVSGFFNIYNSLAAITTVYSLGFKLEKIIEKIKDFSGVKGRFEIINCGQDFSVIVDYAHTPDGLINVLNTARNLTKDRLISVFGCGGDRDKTKRPIMGKIASEYSDMTIITSDNPRTEDPSKIIDDILNGILKNKDYKIEPDRKNAIEYALNTAKKGDIVVIAGKGHEDYQILKDKTIHFDDSEIVREYFSRGGCQPPAGDS